ncbi:hypothetical protein NX059_001438 [Plenodomus lindquistii]|nr:hypothetical protein NX059_001438 [Plenodomus lindquistii]
MSDADDAPDTAVAAPNPDAQTTVNDFLDYTEFFPSDLQRSLTLITDLDLTARDAVHAVHDLTALYGKLPSLPEQDRPDPVALRRQIAHHLRKAIDQREYAYTEASRLYEVAVRHYQRSTVIKKKLQAQPEPPSRDPTPPPVSPTAHRPLNRNYERPPHLRLTFDAGRHGANTSRPRDRHKKTAVSVPRARFRRHSASSGSDSDNIHVMPSPKKRRDRDRARDRQHKSSRPRAPGVLGTNVHSSIAGISTSNALALLAPPPPDARPGSKWAPWGKLTEYEMAVLRKQMKKNAVWTPSLTMVNRELEKKHRTQRDYDIEKARCDAAGEEIIDEEPETLQQIMTASGLGQLAPHGPAAENPPALSEPPEDEHREETGPVSIRLKPVETKEGRKLDRLSQRQQAMRDAQDLVDATEKIKQAANELKGLTFGSHAVATPSSQRKRSAARSATKRKRDTSPAPDEDVQLTREASIATVATQDSTARAPEPKRVKLHPPAPESIASPAPTPSAVSTPRGSHTSVAPSPAPHTPVPLPEVTKTLAPTSVQVPLAPAGPSTPKLIKIAPKPPSRLPTPVAEEPAAPESSPAPVLVVAPPPATTAAASRPRRESVAPKVTSPPEPAAPPVRSSKASTPVPEPVPEAPSPDPAPAPALRPRSARGHVPTPKAQSEEPKPMELSRITRETRRHSLFGQPGIAENPQGTRTSSRRKPPPKGEVTAAEAGQKTVTNVKRAQGSKNKKKRRTEEEAEQVDDIDPNEPKYCICDDVSYGAMISCDNNCDKEWFHLPCMNMTEEDIPSRRAKWYCPDCRAALNTDAYGNPLVPPPLPGRRGNRGWST